MIRTINKLLLFTTAIFFLFFSSCRKKDKIDTSPSAVLAFSTDTILFDTVFTTIGTVTKRLLIYNNNSNKVVVSSIRLAGGDQSVYKLNIDGTPGSILRDVEIPGKDSIFIFIRVTINPTNQNNPLVIADSILFNTNNNLQNVKLIAWGQDAHFYKSRSLKGSNVWDSLKPHVIFGTLRVDTGAALTILPGTKVYFHKNASMAVSSQASLQITGNLEHPVRFQGDRLDPFYRDLPGQWDGIYLEKGSGPNGINYAIIKNGSFGIAADSLLIPGKELTLDNTIIRNVTGPGLFAFSSNIVSTNCVIGDCGSSALDLESGGSYDFRQLTVGNYWSSSVRIAPSVYISNYSSDTLGNKTPIALVKAYFGNCILYGNEEEEFWLDSVAGAPFNHSFEYVLLRSKNYTQNQGSFSGCIFNEDPKFIDPISFNYAIDSISPAIKKGVPMGVPVDINGVDRGDTPDLGAYQYIKKR